MQVRRFYHLIHRDEADDASFRLCIPVCPQDEIEGGQRDVRWTPAPYYRLLTVP